MVLDGGSQSSQGGVQGARLVHQSERHGGAVLGELAALRRHRELCDVVVAVGARRLYAHRVVLAACSPYFRAMFTGELQEARAPEVTIRDVDELAMELLVEFCYTAHVVVEESNVQALLPAACLLQLHEIQEVCCEFLKRQLHTSNCLGIRAFADTHAQHDLLRLADSFTHHNFLEVMESEEFLLLPVSQLLDIISSDELNVRSEEQTFHAVMAWVKYNVAERRHHLPQVLSHVRLPLLSPKFLVGVVGGELLVRSDDACRDLLDEAKNYLLLPGERPHMQGPRTRPRNPMRPHELLFAVGGWCSGDAIASVERFEPRARPPLPEPPAPSHSHSLAHPHSMAHSMAHAHPPTGEWRMVASMAKRRCGVGVGVLGGLLYAVGGHDGQSYLNSIERYDPATNSWCGALAPTTSCRTSVGVAVVEEALYAVGGQDGVQCLAHVERYEPHENRWLKAAGMTTRRLGVAVAVLGGALYAVGGSDGQAPLASVERLDPRAPKWHAVAAMSTRRKHLGAATFDGHIYAVGGRDDCTELSSAERYDARADAWAPVVAMTSRRSGVGLAVVDEQLYAVGGFDGTAYLKSIELYDAELGHWRLAGAMNYRRLGGGVGVMRAPPHHAPPAHTAAPALLAPLPDYPWPRPDSVV